MSTPSPLVLDERFGIVRRIVDYPMPPHFPQSLITRGADVANSLDPTHWHTDRAAIGTAFDDPERAEAAALGEAVERYCGNHVPADLRRASYTELCRRGVPALDPSSIALFSAQQYATPGFPFVPFDTDLQIAWAEGVDLHTAQPCLVPASLVYCNYHWGPARSAEPRTNGLVYAGVAAGPDTAFAQASALEELIERDATAVWWHSGAEAVGIDVADTPRVVAALAGSPESAPGSADGRVDYHFFAIPSAFGAHVVGCLLHDREREIVGAGFACRLDAVDAALKAAAEAIGTWFYSTGILDPAGAIWEAIEAGGLDPRAYKPHRRDRRYLEDFRDDFRDIIDLGAQMQFYLDPRSHVHLRRMLSPRRHTGLGSLVAQGPGSAATAPERRAHLLGELRRRGMRAYAVDLTTHDVRRAGLRVTRALTPDLYTNAPAAAPYFGGDRLLREPHEQGWVAAPLREADLVRAPIPHV